MQPLIVWSQGVVFARIRLLAHLQLVPVAMVLTALHHLTTTIYIIIHTIADAAAIHLVHH